MINSSGATSKAIQSKTAGGNSQRRDVLTAQLELLWIEGKDCT